MRARRITIFAVLLSASTLATSAAAAPGSPLYSDPVATVAGTGSPGEGGDGPATLSELSNPRGVALDVHGNLYIVDSDNSRVRKVDAAGNVTTIAGTGSYGTGGDGPATASALALPYAAAVDLEGNVYIADTSNHRIQRVDTAGNVNTIAGTGSPGSGGDGPAILSDLQDPRDVTVDNNGNVYIADTLNHRVRKVDTAGNITTIAGTGSEGEGGDGPATLSDLFHPSGVTVDNNGNVYLADTRNHRIRKVDTAGNITTVAGTGSQGEGGDGPAILSDLDRPQGIAVDELGNLFIADLHNHRIQMVDTAGNVTTIAGTGTAGMGAEGPAAQSDLDRPQRVAIDASGSVYIADARNDRIQKITVDDVTPTVDIATAAVIPVNTATTISYTCTDTHSPIATCTATIDDQPVNNGDQLTSTTRTTYTLTITAIDTAGNTVTRTAPLRFYGKRELIGTYTSSAGTAGIIARLYMASFVRQPEPAGFGFWTASRDSGTTLEAIADFFISNQEFAELYGDASNSEFVDLMYHNAMDRPADTEGHAFWLGQLDGGMTQPRMLLMLAESPEFKGLTYTS